MSSFPAVVFLLDTPNVWRGRALAGTPARVLGLAEHSYRAGAAVTLVLCDRGADYGAAEDWPCDVLLVHPNDFYSDRRLARVLESVAVAADFVSICEAEALLAVGRELSHRIGARLVYDVHDDEAAVASSLGELPATVRHYGAVQRAALEATDYVFVSTRHEAGLVREAGIDAARVAMLSNGADPQQHTWWGSAVDAATLVFVGNLYYEPNARAVEAIRTTLLPPLRVEGLDIRVRVIGRGPADLTIPTDRLEFTGRVDSINEALRGATLALAPLTAGSGAKMKVLDYLAAGLPVLGTSEAVTGLSTDHPGVVVEDDLSAWPSVLAALLRDRVALKDLGTDGRLSVERELSWPNIGSDLLSNVGIWLDHPAPKQPNAQGATDVLSVPRWLAEHSVHNALGSPEFARQGRPIWLRRSDVHTPMPGA
ncbi:glycosyltransferase family 4 protein [Nocardia sp. BMG51109]|uniref:glycosyltransferase family 4 protein n=1 Tax=Nocardia sp. BMG51109 TaxID=1056816 RepID=UPI0004640E81|nr:glycosyltransferase family 4 protein [Nocardia sp. BMG51109]